MGIGQGIGREGRVSIKQGRGKEGIGQGKCREGGWGYVKGLDNKKVERGEGDWTRERYERGDED